MEDGSPKSEREKFLRVLAVAFILFAGFQSVFSADLTGKMHLAYYAAFIFIWLVSFRYTSMFVTLVGGKDNKPPAWVLILSMQFLVMLFVYNRHKINGMPLINVYVILFTILFAIAFSFSTLYKNTNIKLPGYQNRNFVAPIIILSLLIGYGLSLASNCALIVESTKPYPSAITSKFIESGRSRYGVYHIPHFEVQPWPYSETFGNDIAIPESWFERYENIKEIKAGDSVLLTVNRGLLNLNWMEASKFIQAP